MLIVLSLLVVASLPYLFWWLLNKWAKKEIAVTPKVPMHDCPKHGFYPADASLHMTAEKVGVPDLDIIICPFCWQERLNGAEQIKYQ